MLNYNFLKIFTKMYKILHFEPIWLKYIQFVDTMLHESPGKRQRLLFNC